MDPSDWRLQGQEKWLKGLTLIHQRYYRSENPDWDHDHCEFCLAKFMVGDCMGVLHEGYSSENGYWWICGQCFTDFREMFDWKVVDRLKKS